LALRSAQQGCGNRASQGTSAALAAKSYDILLDQKQGFSREAAIDLEGVRTVLALRSQYGEPKKFLDEPTKYLNLSYYNRARDHSP
jgi:hypothetical protein